MKHLSWLWSLWFVFFMSCSSGSNEAIDEQAAMTAYCNPLSTDHCFLPWPSSYYLKKDSSTVTGYRLNYPKEAMPKNDEGVYLDPGRFNLLDGFSIASEPVVYFKSGVSPEGLPSQKSLADSTTDKSLIWIIEYKTGKRIPLFAEIDANAQGEYIPSLIIRPQVPLEFNTRYVIVLREGLKDGQGNPLEAPRPFARLRDGEPITSDLLRGMQPAAEEIFSMLERQHISRSDVLLAWDFHTASEKAVTSNLKMMVSDAMSKIPAEGPEYSVTETIEHPDAEKEPNLLRQIEGEMVLPSFMESDDPDAWLKIDKQGKPVYRGGQRFSFRVHIPRCALKADKPLPIMFYGHALFQSPKGEMLSDAQKQLINSLCMVQASTRWLGLSEPDLAFILENVVREFSKLPRITDPMLQGHVNMHGLVKLLKSKSFLDEPAMQVNGKPVSDGKELYYVGISNGGNQGLAFLALSKDIERAATQVSAGWWSFMIRRSSNFPLFTLMLKRAYPDPLDQALLIVLSQHLWDYSDAIVFARYIKQKPLPGYGRKQLMMQESLYDDQVPNLATRAVARAVGLDGLEPMINPVYGITGKEGPLDSGYAQFNIHPPIIPPEGNIPAYKPSWKESAHEQLRFKTSAKKQMGAFLKPDGKVINVCNGTCDPD